MHNYISSSQNRASVMIIPTNVTLNSNNEIDLSSAYTNEIGIGTKVSNGYEQFPKETNETTALDKILSDASKGTHFYLRHARNPGGMHPNAHLWDNGNDPVNELKVMKFQQKRYRKFGQNNTPETNAMLEDVFVPIYLFHRYQIEAVSKWLVDLFHAVRRTDKHNS
jgi:hypothetical protein